jgi:hypothetical protein
VQAARLTRDGGSRWAQTVAATLLLAAPLAAFLTTNQYPLVSSEVGILLAACVVAGLLLGFTTALGPTAAALLLGAGAALSIDMLYGLQGSKLLLVLVPVLCLVLAAILRRHIAFVVGVACAVFLATTLLIPSTVARDLARASLRAEAELQAGDKHLPVVLHLILDEHIGIDGLPKDLPESDDLGRWLTDAYLQQGFRIHAGAYSEYFDTRNSIPNLLNFTSRDSEWAHLAKGQTKPYVLTDSAYFRHLSRLGYRLHVYQSDHLDYCRVAGVSYSTCFGYRANSIGSLPGTALGAIERAQFILNSFIATSTYLNKLRAIYAKLRGSLETAALPEWDHAVSRVGPLAVLPVLKQLEDDLRSASRGHAYFAHLLIPHYPYVLDESCSVREEIEHWLYNRPAVPEGQLVQNTAATRAERYRSYFAQVRCQQALLNRLFDAMKDAGVWRDALVVIHGDHGSRIVRHLPAAANASRLTREDFGDSFSTLFVARIPGRQAGVVRDPQPLQELLSEAFELPLDPLSRKVYLRAKDGKALSPHSLSVFAGQDAPSR